MTQPTGHSTSGSHERYKSKERLQWEQDYDCLVQFRKWIVDNKIASEDELDNISKEVKEFVKQAKKEAWQEYQNPLKEELNQLFTILNTISDKCEIKELDKWTADLKQSASFGLFRRDFLSVARKVLARIATNNNVDKSELVAFINKIKSESSFRYNSKLYNETEYSARNVKEVLPTYASDSEEVDARIILRDNFDKMFSDIPEAMIFGEDVGKIGGVNQGVEGLQAKVWGIKS